MNGALRAVDVETSLRIRYGEMHQALRQRDDSVARSA